MVCIYTFNFLSGKISKEEKRPHIYQRDWDITHTQNTIDKRVAIINCSAYNSLILVFGTAYF